jgi:hypothetical protein
MNVGEHGTGGGGGGLWVVATEQVAHRMLSHR